MSEKTDKKIGDKKRQYNKGLESKLLDIVTSSKLVINEKIHERESLENVVSDIKKLQKRRSVI